MKEIMQGIALLFVLAFVVIVAVEACSSPPPNDCHEYSDGRLLCDDGFEVGP